MILIKDFYVVYKIWFELISIPSNDQLTNYWRVCVYVYECKRRLIFMRWKRNVGFMENQNKKTPRASLKSVLYNLVTLTLKRSLNQNGRFAVICSTNSIVYRPKLLELLNYRSWLWLSSGNACGRIKLLRTNNHVTAIINF